MRDTCFQKGKIPDWRAYLTDRGDESVLNRTWQSLKTGWPAGDVRFVRRLKEILGRRLMAVAARPAVESKSLGMEGEGEFGV